MSKFSQGLPVNELGEIVVSSGVGSSNIVGTVPVNAIPVDSITGGLRLNKVAQLATDAGGGLAGISDSSGIIIPNPLNGQRYAPKVGKTSDFTNATISTQTLATAVKTTFPGTSIGALRITPQTASASGTLIRTTFAAPLDWSDVSCMHVPVQIGDTSSAGAQQLYLTLYFDSGTNNRVTYMIDTTSLVPGAPQVIPVQIKQPAFIGASRTAISTTSAAAVVSGGSGYAVGDLFQPTGGVGTPPTFKVTTISAGAVTGAALVDAGAYTTVPTNAVSVVAITGAGTGATFNLTTTVTSSTARTDGWFSTAGTINWANVHSMAVQITNATTASAGNVYTLGNLLPDYKALPAAMIGFDGAYVSQWTYVLPILKKYNIQATFYIQWYQLGQSGRMTLAQVKAISDAGHKIALHSYSADLNTTDTGAWPTSASIAAEVSGFMAAATAAGLNVIRNHAAIAISSPFEGSVNLATAATAYAGYTTGGLTTLRAGNDSYNQGRVYSRSLVGGPIVQTRILKSTTTPDELASYLDAGETVGGVSSTYGHTCVANSPSGNDFSAYLLDQYCQQLATRRGQGRLVIITPDRL